MGILYCGYDGYKKRKEYSKEDEKYAISLQTMSNREKYYRENLHGKKVSDLNETDRDLIVMLYEYDVLQIIQK